MPHLYLDKRKSPPIWRFQIWDARGKRKSFTGTTSKRETLDMAVRRQAYEKELAGGLRTAPESHAHSRDIEEVFTEYMLWGQAQGGRGGRPWARAYVGKVRSALDYWKKALQLSRVLDLRGTLSRVENEIRKMKADGYAGKTIFHKLTTLKAFCTWSIDRQYLRDNPYTKLQSVDTTPTRVRRAMTKDEINRLLISMDTNIHSQRRRLGYELALASGLRRLELRALRVKHLDTKRGGVVLEANWTKNRKPGFQPLPKSLVTKLGTESKNKELEDPLVFIPWDTATAFYRDLTRARIPKETPEGVLDFHAMRVAYITMVLESGVDLKTAQTLARHSSPQLTANLYARSRDERLSQAAEAVGSIIFQTEAT